MNAIKATWKDGQILPLEPVDWPEGSELVVQPIALSAEKIGLSEDEWRDEADAIAAWETWVRGIEPPEFTDQERAELARYREEYRRFNLEAVRRQMDAENQP
jgi:hypothetical protein